MFIGNTLLINHDNDVQEFDEFIESKLNRIFNSETINELLSYILQSFSALIKLIDIYSLKIMAALILLTAYKLLVPKSVSVTQIIWSRLTPGSEWLEIGMVCLTICSGLLVFIGIKGMSEVLEQGFTKLKDDIAIKDERIKKLEEELRLLKTLNNTKE